MKKITIIGLVILSILSIGCSSGIVVSNLAERNKTAVTEVHLVSSKEVATIEGDKVGDIILKENSNLDWNFLKNKLIETAKQNGANYITINNIGYNLKGYGFYLEGTMYHTNKPVSKPAEQCEIGFIRDRFESVLGSAFTIDIQVEGNEVGELKKDKSLSYEVKDCNSKLYIQINKNQQLVHIDGKSKYFKIGRQTSGNHNGSGINVGIGGLSVQEIEDVELGKLLYLQNK